MIDRQEYEYVGKEGKYGLKSFRVYPIEQERDSLLLSIRTYIGSFYTTIYYKSIHDFCNEWVKL